MAVASRLLQAHGVGKSEAPRDYMARSVSERVVLASLGERLAAKAVDLVIACGPVLAGALSTWRTPAFVATYVLGLGYACLYLLLADGVGAGQSVGKRLFGVIAVDARTQRPCSLAQSVRRNACLGLGALDLAFILAGGSRRLGDEAARTVVVLAPGSGGYGAVAHARPLARRWLKS